MNKVNKKTLKPHLIAIGIFLLIAVIYNAPVLQGKVPQQGDVVHWKGMAENSMKFKETHGYLPLWTNGMFCGMPAYQIAMDGQNPFNLIYIHKLLTLFLPNPIAFFFLLCIGFYFLTQVLRIDYRIGILGALSYAYMSFNPILVVAGHDTEIISLGYVPLLLGSIILVFQKRYWVGASFAALFTANLIAFNHLQVIYYTLFIAGFMAISYAINFIKKGEIAHLIKSVAILAAVAGLGAATNMVNLATTYDYSQATMRNGGLNIDTATNKQTTSSGLNIDYAFAWSYGQNETFTLLVPNIYGGGSTSSLGTSSNTAKLAESNGMPADQVSQFASQFLYWGAQPFTTGPVYLGAIICFLFVLGMVYYKGNDKWWMLAVSVLAIMMSWGKNFLGFNEFLFNNFPLYNKFRVPTMALVIPQIVFPILGVLTLQQLFFAESDKAAAWKKVRTAGYVMLGIFAVVAALYTSLDYKGPNDGNFVSAIEQATGNNKDVANSFYNALKADRQSLFGSDILRSLFFAGGAFLLLWLMLKSKIKDQYVLLMLLALASLDVITEGRRYLNTDSFQTKDDQASQYFTPSPADTQILQDTGYYRVLNLSQDVFNDALTSYFHNSIGGYHPAKLAIMEDLLNFQLRKQPMNLKVLNMLNAKYIIVPGPQNEPQPQQNPGALGPCWFVKNVEVVKDGVAAMKALDSFNPADTAIVEEDYKKGITAMPVADSTASIQLIKNDNDIITYKSSSHTNQFAVFSEIYYDRGWKAYIDDKEAPIVKTNYALRGLSIPAGNHNIRFEFKPDSFYKSRTIANASSAVVWALLAFTIFWYVRRKKKENTALDKS